MVYAIHNMEMSVPSFEGRVPFTILDRIIRLPGIVNTMGGLSPSRDDFTLVKDNEKANDMWQAQSELGQDLRAAHAAEQSNGKQGIYESSDNAGRGHIFQLNREIGTVLADAMVSNAILLLRNTAPETAETNKTILDYAMALWQATTDMSEDARKTELVLSALNLYNKGTPLTTKDLDKAIRFNSNDGISGFSHVLDTLYRLGCLEEHAHFDFKGDGGEPRPWTPRQIIEKLK